LFEETGMPSDALKYFGLENMPYIVSIFRSFLILQPVFLFGSIYFKKNQAFKTFAAIMLLYLLLGILGQIEVKLILGDDGPVVGKDLELWGKTVAHTAKIYFYFLQPLFFCVVSYFRLTEKQV
jgi:uncharacterized membrane protein